ncbi:MAG: hypothetical protein JWR70_1539 [Modestobacter sp.]|nr:hypothetical protein [Modestobacter sp.]
MGKWAQFPQQHDSYGKGKDDRKRDKRHEGHGRGRK